MTIFAGTWRMTVAGLLAMGLAACDNDRNDAGDGGEEALTAVSGVAAVGLPLVNSAVEMRCGNAVTRSATTGADGAWNTTVPTAALPCAVQVSGGSVGGAPNAEVFHSFARAASGTQVANLTPLTSLTLAHAVQGSTGGDLAEWFQRADLGATLQQVDAATAAARAAVSVALSGAGYALPSEAFDAFSAPFSAITGDGYDDLLEALGDALENDGGSYAALFRSFAGGGTLPVVLTPSAGESIVYDGQTHAPVQAEASYRYQTEACAGAYNVFGGGFDGLTSSLLVRVGMLKPEAGSVELDIAALEPGVGTRGPVAPGKVQLYLYFASDNQTWTDAASQGKVTVDFDGTEVRVRASDIVLANGKKISFDLRASYIEAQPCKEPSTRALKAVEAAKDLAGSYPLRLYGGSCAAPLQAADSAFTGTLQVGGDGGFSVTSDADGSRKVGVTPDEDDFDVPAANGYDYTLNYVAGERRIRLINNDNHAVPTHPDHIQIVEVVSGEGCHAFFKRGMAEATGDAGAADGAGLGGADGAILTLKGVVQKFDKSTINGGTYVDAAFADGRSDFGAGQFKEGSTTEGKPNVRISLMKLPTAPGKYDCTSFYEMRVSITVPAATGNGTVNYSSGGADTCTVEILEADLLRKKVRGRFSATLTGTPGNEVVTVSDGYFFFKGY